MTRLEAAHAGREILELLLEPAHERGYRLKTSLPAKPFDLERRVDRPHIHEVRDASLRRMRRATNIVSAPGRQTGPQTAEKPRIFRQEQRNQLSGELFVAAKPVE